MALDIWTRDDIRNVILATRAAGVASGDDSPVGRDDPSAYQAGFDAALAALAQAFGVPLVRNGQLRTPGVVIPVTRLAVSYRAEKALARLLTMEGR